MKYVKIGNLKPLKDFEKVVPIKNMFSIITIATAIIFSIYVINIASVNEVTRTSVDKSAQDDGKINFDSRMEKDTTRLK